MGETATFAAGCFWGVEDQFGSLPGVLSTRVGYIGGQSENPTYRQVCSGDTGHAEAVELIFDPEQITYEELLLSFWAHHDPTTPNRQGPDVGTQYRSAVFTHSEQQRVEAEKVKDRLKNRFSNPIVTEIVPSSTFYEAEEYHQKYNQKNGRHCAI